MDYIFFLFFRLVKRNVEQEKKNNNCENTDQAATTETEEPPIRSSFSSNCPRTPFPQVFAVTETHARPQGSNGHSRLNTHMYFASIARLFSINLNQGPHSSGCSCCSFCTDSSSSLCVWDLHVLQLFAFIILYFHSKQTLDGSVSVNSLVCLCVSPCDGLED